MSRIRLWRGLVVALATAAGGVAGAPAPPSPSAILGFEPCADRTLATSEQIAGYFQALDRESGRMELVDIGRSSEGRGQFLAVISSEANLANLEEYRSIAQRLARPYAIGQDEAAALSARGKAVVWINFGLHSTEVAHAQAAPLLAHRLVSDESAEMAFIRENVIFLLAPDLNPDGTTMMANWYRSHMGTPYQDTLPPDLYQTYAGHDNNRDWFMFNLVESRNVARQLYQEWLPQIVYDQHQSAPFPARIFVPPFDDPLNPQIPPLVVRGVNLVGDAISRRLDREGKTGAVSRVNFDMWWNGGMRTSPYFHNMIGILTETAHASATPATYDPDQFPRTFQNGRPTLLPSADYPNPYRGGEWHLRDSCDYMVSASLAVLDIGARRREEWLHDIYRMGRTAIDGGAGEFYIVPAHQWDDGTAAHMINVLRWGGVDVQRATRPFQIEDRSYAAGSFVIRGAQPFRPYLTDLLNPQVYPDPRLNANGSPDRPYDITGWTLPLQMGVEVDRFTDIETPDAGLVPVDWAPPARSSIPEGRFAGYLLDPRANAVFTAVNRLHAAGVPVSRLYEPVSGEPNWPAGAFLVRTGPRVSETLARSLDGLDVTAAGLDALPGRGVVALQPPRVGLYKTWGGNPDEGWTRWLFEEFELPYRTIRDGDLKTGQLLDRFDVIVLPDASYNRMLTGLSTRVAPEEFAGGMTSRGVSSLTEFVDQGGTLVALDSATELPLIAFDLGIRDVAVNRSAAEYSVPGTLVRVDVDPSRPLGFGLQETTAVFFAESPVFSVDPAEASDLAERTQIVASYPDENPLLSGWLLGQDVLQGHAAVLDVRVGAGRVVLIGFRPQHRGQSHGTFKFLLNALTLEKRDP